MERLENFYYQKLNYMIYRNKLIEFDNNENLKQLGFQRNTLNHTIYGYPIDYITIGNGDKDLFLVGGTHGSEMIGVDFLLNFIEQLPDMNSFNPNLITLHIIPLQNPEGFDISSNTLKKIDASEFHEKSYEYYLRYRTDSIVILALRELELFFQDYNKLGYENPIEFLNQLKDFFNKNVRWNQLLDSRVIPRIKRFNEEVNKLENIKSFDELEFALIMICDAVFEEINSNLLADTSLCFFLNELKKYFLEQELSQKQQKRLYQQMFEDEVLGGYYSKELYNDVNKMYQIYQHPKGSQIGHDATGVGINLNANHLRSPGLDVIRSNQVIYGPGVKNNLRNYVPGPLGVPCLDVSDFQYSIENQVLEDLIKSSYDNNRYLATLLYHGTGGLIYYQPFEGLMEENTYLEFSKYNEEIAQIYGLSTDYRLLNESDTSGYGDYLRRTYPGVLMIELSKMGGNPIGPYGDKNNIYRVFSDNTNAIDSLFELFSNRHIKTKTKYRK